MIKKNLAAFIVPTGVGASIGGFAGDASKDARLISERCSLIVNPNVVNAACFSGITENMLYTEGFALDLFFKKEIALKKAQNNKIGVIFDKSIPQNILNIHINTINAVETVYGLDEIKFDITEEEVNVHYEVTKEGISTGNIKNPETLLNCAEKLLNQGCEAIAIVCLFEDNDDGNYSNGMGVDPVGGVEAIISHLITKTFRVPSAHAPAFKTIDITTEIVDKRAASEYITPTFLPCILLGLQNAPKLIPYKEASADDFKVDDLKCLIMPYNALGSIPVLKANELNIPVLAMKENSTLLNITKEELNLPNIIIINKFNDIFNYLN